MAKLSKRQKAINEKVDANTTYSFEDAIAILKEVSSVKFSESCDIALNLGVDPRKSDQVVRGATVLPNGTGKDVRVAVFTQGAKVKKGNMDFDVVIASPDAMRVVGQLGQILGPRGLMPNPKVGTVTPDVATAVKNAKAGQVQYRTDKSGIIHATIGKLAFEAKALNENLSSLLEAVKKAKPTSAKGTYLKKLSLSSTMGPGLQVDIATVEIKD